MYIGLTVAAFYMPNETFIQYGSACAVFAGMFLLVQLVLLIDFGYRWSEKCLELYEDTDNRQYLTLLGILTVSLLIAAVVGTGLLFGYFGPTECPLNQFFISFNLIIGFITCLVSIHPRIQESNPTSGLPVAAVVCAYCTYLVSSAIMNEPEDLCNPLADTKHPRTFGIAVGAFFTFVALVYTTSNTAVQHRAFTGSDAEYVPLTEMSEGDRPETMDEFDDEVDACTYNYSFFHLIFAIASMYVAMLLTNWDSGVGVQEDIGKSWKAGWVKVITSWIAYVMYNWTMIAPVIFPDRNWA